MLSLLKICILKCSEDSPQLFLSFQNQAQRNGLEEPLFLNKLESFKKSQISQLTMLRNNSNFGPVQAVSDIGKELLIHTHQNWNLFGACSNGKVFHFQICGFNPRKGRACKKEDFLNDSLTELSKPNRLHQSIIMHQCMLQYAVTISE